MHSLQRLWYSKKENILKQLSEADLKRAYAHSVRIQKNRSELFWLDDEHKQYVYIVDQGYIRMCRTNEEGKRLITSIMGPSEVFGAVVPGLENAETDDYAEVVRDSRIIGIEAEIFHEILEKYPKLMIRLFQILEMRRRTMEKRMYSFLFKDVYARTVELLLELSEKYGEECPFATGVFRDVNLTHQEIADFLGVARPTISTVISELMKADLLHKHKQMLCINDWDGLVNIADEGSKALSGVKSK